MTLRDATLSRRRLFALSTGVAATALGVTACGEGGGGKAAPSASNVLAANVNEALDRIDFAQLRAADATWVRGFYPMADADQGDPAHQAGLAKLLEAAANGYGTVLTTKFQYRDRRIPSPGSPAMKTALSRFDKVLAATIDKVDILTVGNEPFIETSKADRRTPALNAFYEALARHAVEYRDAHGRSDGRTQIYLGALTGLDKPGGQTAQTRRWMTFAADNPSIAGVDIHPHVADPADAQTFVDYALRYLRKDQKFLATEFSLVDLWRKHNTDEIDPEFASNHGIAKGTPVWKYIKHAANVRVSEQEWNDFVLSCPWFTAHENFLTDQMARFRDTGKLAVAGYGFIQAVRIPDYGPKSAPWVLNAVYPQYMTERRPGGLPGRNRTWYDAFRAAQSP